MKIKLFGHPLKTRAHGTVSVQKSVKTYTIFTNRELCTTKWHPSYATVTFQVRHEKPSKKHSVVKHESQYFWAFPEFQCPRNLPR